MCGIAGGIALHPTARPDPARVARLSCGVAHRGPDGDGLWTSPDGRAILAHRRLSIIDLATGQQPMLSEDGRVGLVFNGEIYNYRELRRELLAHGVSFRTDSDTEVLLRLIQRDGAECVRDLRGMFAFAAYDTTTGRLTMARDRVGKKPLFHVVEDGCLYFASTLGALSDTATRRWEIDPAAVDDFMTLGYVPAPETIYRGVGKLPAAAVAVVRDGPPAVASYWDLAELEPFEGSESAALDRLEELLTTAVSIRLRSDVPLGVFLSGGVDSSLVTAIAARQAEGTLHTFSIGFGERDFDESEYAAAVAAHVGAEHRLFRVEPNLIEFLPDMVRHAGEPFADPSTLPTWVLARETRRHVTVALGGDGGDEGFGGYAWYRNAERLSRLGRLIPRTAAGAGSWTLERLAGGSSGAARAAGRLGRGLAVLAADDEAGRFASLRSFMGRREADLLYAGELRALRAARGPAAAERLAELYATADGSALRRMRYVDIRTYLADCLLPKVDIATMAYALEARAPLLDQEVLAFALSLPDEWVTGPGGGKLMLRRLLDRYFPPGWFDRPKHGFTVPLTVWFTDALRQQVDALARSERFAERGWFQPEGIATLIAEHRRGARDHSQRLFNLLILDAWLARA